jgi:hypothetical protein
MSVEELSKEIEILFGKIVNSKSRNAEEEMFVWKVYNLSQFVIKKIGEKKK